MKFRTFLLLAAFIAGSFGMAGSAIAADPETNEAPVCGETVQSKAWPPNHKFKTPALTEVTDPDNDEGDTGDTLTVTEVAVFQDEPLNGAGDGNTTPDAQVTDDGTIQVRGERAGGGNGRFYHISVTYEDTEGNEVTCESVAVTPHDMGQLKGKGKGLEKKKLGDEGSLYNSLG